MKYVKCLSLLFLIASILIIVFFIHPKKEESPKKEIKDDINEIIENTSYLSNYAEDNNACIFNNKLNLMKCDNILEEKYDIYNNLIYIKTKNEEYFYNYSYYGSRVVQFSYNDLTMNIDYDDAGRIIKLDIINKNKKMLIICEYKPFIEDDTIIPQKIISYDENNNINYYINIEKTVKDGFIYITEKKFDQENHLILIREYYYRNRETISFFEQINYIPEPYYTNNFFDEIKYKYANHGTYINSFYPQVNFIDQIIENNEKINHYEHNNIFYNNNYEYIKFLSNDYNCVGEKYLNLIVFKKNNEYYKYNINKNCYQNIPLYIVERPVKIDYEEYNKYINLIFDN